MEQIMQYLGYGIVSLCVFLAAYEAIKVFLPKKNGKKQSYGECGNCPMDEQCAGRTKR